MSLTNFWTEQIDSETESECSCCQRSIYEGEGVLNDASGELALYGYRWSDGHSARFILGIVLINQSGETEPGMGVVSCESRNKELVYSVVEPDSSPWKDTAALGPILTRQQVLDDEVIPNYFQLVDAISAHEERLSTRILQIENNDE